MLPSLRGRLTPREGAGQLPVFLLDQGYYPTDDLPLDRNASPEAAVVKEEGKLHGIHAQRILEAGARGWSGSRALVRHLRLFYLGDGHRDDWESAAQQGAIAKAVPGLVAGARGA